MIPILAWWWLNEANKKKDENDLLFDMDPPMWLLPIMWGFVAIMLVMLGFVIYSIDWSIMF